MAAETKNITEELKSSGNLAEIKKLSVEDRKKLLNKMIGHLNTIDADDKVNPQERQKARDFLVQVRRLDLDHTSKLDDIAKETGVNLTGLKADLARFDEFESGKVVEGGDKNAVDAAFKDLTAAYPSYTKNQLMIMAQKGLDLGDNGEGELAPRYDSVIGEKLTAAAKDAKVYIDRYIDSIKDPGTAAGDEKDPENTNTEKKEEEKELGEWQSKIDMASIEPKKGTQDEKLKTLQDMRVINEKSEPIGYFKSLMALPSKFIDQSITYDQLALLNTNVDSGMLSTGSSFEEGAAKSTEDETEDMVTMKDGHAVIVHDNPGNQPTFEVDGTDLFDDYRFTNMSAFIDFVRKNGKVQETDKGVDIAMEEFGKRLEGGKDGQVAKYMQEKGYINTKGDIDNQFNSLMSLPGEAWGEYKLTMGDIERFEDSSNYDFREFDPSGNDGTGFGMNLLAARFNWENGKVVCDELKNESFDNVEKMMQHLKKVEDTMPEDYSLKDSNDFSKMKPEEIKTKLNAQAKTFKDRMPISGLQIDDITDDKKIVVKRDDTGRATTITRTGNDFSITVKGKPHTFNSFEQAAAVANLINFTDKFLTTKNIEDAGGAITPFVKNGSNGISYNVDDWFDTNFLDDGDKGANYYHANINGGIDSVIPILNDVYNEKILAIRKA